MKNSRIKRVRVLLGIFLLIIFLLVPMNVGHAEDEVTVDLTLSPQTELFNLGNIKPGDSVVRIITVQNTGNVDFGYTAYARQVSGSSELYDSLLLTIEDSEGVLYDGKLTDFGLLAERNLVSGSEEDLAFTIKSPEGLGNEYQNLSMEFEIIFQATGQVVSPGDGEEDPPATPPEDGEQTVDPPSDQELPDTATNNYNLMAIGLVIVLAGSTLYYFQRKRQQMKE